MVQTFGGARQGAKKPLLGIVPARGGSKSIPQKNLQVVDGLPLFLHAARALSRVCSVVYVSTDDPDVASAVMTAGFYVHYRDDVPDDQTILEAARVVVDEVGWGDGVVLLQPTSAFVVVDDFVAEVRRDNQPLVAGVEITHQVWKGPFTPLVSRVNRQFRFSDLRQEVGLYYWPKSREVGSPPERMVTVHYEGHPDIDTPADLAALRSGVEAKTIALLYDETREIGSGHRRRMETLAAAMPWHYCDVMRSPQGMADISKDYDLVITDRLDTYVRPVEPPWITFEDCGPATKYADAVINALYPSGRSGARVEYSGPDWAILRPEFQVALDNDYTIRDDGRKVLVMFGGTDPADMMGKVGQALDPLEEECSIQTTYVPPGAQEPIAALMSEHDLLITSAGRTVYEAAAVGIPTLVYPANAREATHVHVGPEYGNMLGTPLPGLIEPELLRSHALHLLDNPDLRATMSDVSTRQVDGRGLERVVWLVESILKGMPV